MGLRLIVRLVSGVALTGFVLTGTCLAVQQDNESRKGETRSLSSGEFNQLSLKAKRAMVARAFQQRLAFAQNLHYEVDSKLLIRCNNDGAPGDIKEKCGFRRYRDWRLDGSFRLESDCYRPGDDDTVVQWCNSGFDADEGVARSTVIIKAGREIKNARIDTTPDTIVIDDDYAYWLSGNFMHEEDFLLQDLLEHQNEWKFRKAEGNLVQLVCPFRPWWAVQPGGDRIMSLDLEKGFMPVAGQSRYDSMEPDGTLTWRIERFAVEQSRNVDGVWMPIRLQNSVAASPAPETFTVIDVKVVAIEHGRVTATDLEVPFTEGMTVVDAINAVTYVADANGNPAGAIEPVYGAGTIAQANRAVKSPTSISGRSLVLISVGVFGVIAALAFSVLRARRA